MKVLFNVSDTIYQHGVLTPVYGNGQGSTNSCDAWVYCSNQIFKTYRTEAKGAYYNEPLQHYSINLYLAGFINDINLYTNLFNSINYSVNTLITQLTDNTKLFSELLWTTGRKLEPQKCKYTVMHWLFKDNGKPYLDTTTYSDILICTDTGEIISKIQNLLPSNLSKYLGFLKDTAGTQYAQATDLAKKIKMKSYTWQHVIFRQKFCIHITLQSFSNKFLILYLYHISTRKNYVLFRINSMAYCLLV